ncbi:MAG: hypothetical protein V4710_05590 [Verrucomicrobiota bacterium]
MSTPSFPTLRFLLWTLLTWTVLFAAAYALHNEFFEKSIYFSFDKVERAVQGLLATGLAVSLALLLGRAALRISNVSRWLRVLFWIPVLPMAAYIVIRFCAAWYMVASDPSLVLSAIAAMIPSVVAGWLVFQAWRARPRRIFPEMLNIALALLCLAFVGLASLGITRLRVKQIHRQAEKRWMEIGRPMAEYGKHLIKTEENEAFKTILTSLQPLGVQSLYKRRDGEPEVNDAQNVPQAELMYMDAGNRPLDEIAGPADPLVYREARAKDLAHLYQTILQEPTPVWSLNQADGWTVRVPNFLALRKLAQLAATDCLMRLHENDLEGAAQGRAAILKLNSPLREQPLLVSVMINVAIEAMFAKITARLPEDPAAWNELAEKARVFRQGLIGSLQADAYGAGNQVPPTEEFKWDPKTLADSTLERLTSGLPLQLAHAYHAYAEQVDILQKYTDYLHGDLGENAMNDVLAKYPDNIVLPHITRALCRLNGMLILLEQAEMIRFARARMEEGVHQAERASVVIPGAKWEMIADPATHSVSLKLSTVPGWLLRKDILPPEFFLLPLDGTQSWTFRKPTPSAPVETAPLVPAADGNL